VVVCQWQAEGCGLSQSPYPSQIHADRFWLRSQQPCISAVRNDF